MEVNAVCDIDIKKYKVYGIEFSADAVHVSAVAFKHKKSEYVTFHDIMDNLKKLDIDPSRVEILCMHNDNHDKKIDDDDFAVIASFVNLKVLSVQELDGIKSLEPLRGLCKLQSLDIIFCRNVKDVEPIKDLPIKELETSYMDTMSNIDKLCCPVERLMLCCADEISFITQFKDTLKSVDLVCGSDVTNFVPLTLLPKMETLCIEMFETHVPRHLVDILSHIQPLRKVSVTADCHYNVYTRTSSDAQWETAPIFKHFHM